MSRVKPDIFAWIVPSVRRTSPHFADCSMMFIHSIACFRRSLAFESSMRKSHASRMRSLEKSSASRSSMLLRRSRQPRRNEEKVDSFAFSKAFGLFIAFRTSSNASWSRCFWSDIFGKPQQKKLELLSWELNYSTTTRNPPHLLFLVQ